MFFGEPVNIVPETMGIVWGYAFECKKLNDTNTSEEVRWWKCYNGFAQNL